jgi:hypothetical protein
VERNKPLDKKQTQDRLKILNVDQCNRSRCLRNKNSINGILRFVAVEAVAMLTCKDFGLVTGGKQ